MATIGTMIFTWLNGALVGTDELGNRYYRERGGKRTTPIGFNRERRWVIFAGEAEASKVPPHWHAWLHHSVVEPPIGQSPPSRPWQKEHLPNQTGTDAAYRPPGHTLAGAARARATGDYQPWTPN
ncbi:MAG: NADH:ubiquinone oxidoreductase subunit NDUFA12 [Alphaproteobacteria bacterium]|nr:NADH:ubiquinone oxidoreductase subunit NDUFA12 [Alphaproteobacteria bacterium]